MAWKAVGACLAEFAGGLGAIRVGLPMDSLPASVGLTTAGIVLTVLGLAGLSRLIQPPQPRRYAPEQESPESQ